MSERIIEQIEELEVERYSQAIDRLINTDWSEVEPAVLTEECLRRNQMPEWVIEQFFPKKAR